MLSVIIPTLNAAKTLPKTLMCLVGPTASGLVKEVIVVDGGSQDQTRRIVKATGARLVETAPGRGNQLAEGAQSAKAGWLLFLHGDTVLEKGWEQEVRSFIEREEATGKRRAGVFRFALDDYGLGVRWLEKLVRARCFVLALPYGDQGLLISRHLYNNVGGYDRVPLMEDIGLVRRLGRRRLVFFRTKAVTSARRYKEGGYLARPLKNLIILSLYFMRVPPRFLVRHYG